MLINWIKRLYQLLLRLYPLSFQKAFAQEMQEIFSEAAAEASRCGRLALIRFCLSEIAGLAGALVQAYSGGPETAGLQTDMACMPEIRPEPSWKEIVLALVFFGIPAVMLGPETEPSATTLSGLQVIFLFLVVMLLIGRLGGFPLWSLPYVGIILSIAGYLYVFQWVTALLSPALIAGFVPGTWQGSSYQILQILSAGMIWLMLFCLTLLVVALLALFNRFQPLLGRMRHDWTLISYILYGESVFALLLLESRQYEPSYTTASLLCLAAGLWFYLRSPTRRQRLLALLTCLTLAMSLITIQGQLVAADSYPPVMLQSGLIWLCMILAILLPGLLLRRPVPRTG